MNIPQIVIVRSKNGQSYANFIAKEINLRGYRTLVVPIKDLPSALAKNQCSPNKTIVYTRTAHPNYIYRMLKKIENKGYRVINTSESIKLTSDKFLSCLYAHKNSIPCAETIIANQENLEEKINEKLPQWKNLIVKPKTSQGNGVFCYKLDKDNIEEIKNKIKNIPTKLLVVQKFIDYQRLNRVIVIGNKALDKCVFWDEPEGWKCSVCLNTKIKVDKNPDPNLLGLAETIAEKFGSEISFIDIFTTNQGYVLSEINVACSLIIHERISRYNISRDISNYLLKQLGK